MHDFGKVPPRAFQAAPPTREAYQEEVIEPIGDRNDLYWFEFAPQRNREDAYGLGDERLTTLPQVRTTRDTSRADTPLTFVRRPRYTSRSVDCGCRIGGSSFLEMACDFGVVRFSQSLWREYANSGQP